MRQVGIFLSCVVAVAFLLAFAYFYDLLLP